MRSGTLSRAGAPFAWRPFSAWQFAVLVGLLFGLPAAFIFCGSGYMESDRWYWEGFIGDTYRRSLGFGTGPFATDAGRVWAITSVTPGGVFDLAGVKVGDTPVAVSSGRPHQTRSFDIWYHGSNQAATVFYGFLHRNAGRGPCEFTVSRCSDRGHGRPCRHDTKKIVIEVPDSGAKP